MRCSEEIELKLSESPCKDIESEPKEIEIAIKENTPSKQNKAPSVSKVD